MARSLRERSLASRVRSGIRRSPEPRKAGGGREEKNSGSIFPSDEGWEGSTGFFDIGELGDDWT